MWAGRPLPWTRLQCRHSISRHFFNGRVRFQPRVTHYHAPYEPPPTFRESLRRSVPPSDFKQVFGRPNAWPHVSFAVGASSLAFAGAALYTNIDTEDLAKKFTSLQVWGTKSVSSLDLQRTKNLEVLAATRAQFASLNSFLESTPGIVRGAMRELYLAFAQPYVDATAAKRLCWKLCLLNFSVWVLWKLRPDGRLMKTYAAHNPLSGRTITLLTSVFSHYAFLHLLFNCLALESFGTAAELYLLNSQAAQPSHRLESTVGPHFIAFFVSAGIFASLTSHLARTQIIYPRVIKSLSNQLSSSTTKVGTWANALAQAHSQRGAGGFLRRFRSPKSSSSSLPLNSAAPAMKESGVNVSSLGASGAIWACVTMTALAFPDAQMALFIPPTYPFSIQWGALGLIALDIVGVLRGWRLFDHYAHLAGACFGAVYYHYGPGFWDWQRSLSEGFARKWVEA